MIVLWMRHYIIFEYFHFNIVIIFYKIGCFRQWSIIFNFRTVNLNLILWFFHRLCPKTSGKMHDEKLKKKIKKLRGRKRYVTIIYNRIFWKCCTKFIHLNTIPHSVFLFQPNSEVLKFRPRCDYILLFLCYIAWPF